MSIGPPQQAEQELRRDHHGQAGHWRRYGGWAACQQEERRHWAIGSIGIDQHAPLAAAGVDATEDEDGDHAGHADSA
jgi:hypothetical protein